jgi:hypothetical protein
MVGERERVGHHSSLGSTKIAHERVNHQFRSAMRHRYVSSCGAPATSRELGGEAAVDDQVDAGDVSRFVGGEEEHGMGGVPAGAHVAHRALRGARIRLSTSPSSP